MRGVARALALALALATSAAGVPSRDEASVHAFLARYFATWSARDMAGYADCFDPSARISFVLPGGAIRAQDLPEFLESQRLAHAHASAPMTEAPTSIEVGPIDRITHARVRWKLTRGSDVTTGVDLFVLVRAPGGWKIASLVFFND